MASALEIPNVSAVANWFGSSRMVAARIGIEIGKPSLCVVPFAGGMSELPYIDAAKILVNDKHRHVVNLARVMSDRVLGPQLYRRLREEIFHPDTLDWAQAFCSRIDLEKSDARGLFPSAQLFQAETPEARLEWAHAYAIATWMGRGGNSGTRGEFGGSLPIRFSPNGGGSGQRFHNWVASIPTWRRVLRACEFSTEDAFDLLDKTHDAARCSVYSDSPWPDAGDGYTNSFTDVDQRRLARKLATFKAARVVVRFADHPLIRELYPETHWTWLTYPSRAQTNGGFDEVLLLNGPSLAEAR